MNVESNASANPTQPQSLVAMVTSLAVGLPNEEFGLLSRWMTSEANRRRERIAAELKKGDPIVFINYSDKLTRGVVQKLGGKNALVKTENGGRMYVPLARLEKEGRSHITTAPPTLASLPSVAPPPPSEAVLASARPKRASKGKKAPPKVRRASRKPTAA